MKKVGQALSNLWQNYRSLILRLVLPLTVISLLLLVLVRPISTHEVAVNLATDLVTIVVTVLYVDWVIRQYDEERWARAEAYIAGEAATVGNSFIRDVSGAIGIEDEIYERPFLKDITQMQKSIIQRVSNLDRFVIEDALARFQKKQWQSLMAIVEARMNDAGPVISQFGPRLDADELASLLEFRSACSLILNTYSIFSGFLGVPIQKLPKVRDGKPEEFLVLTIIRMGIDFKRAFAACLGIFDAFDYVVGPLPDTSKETEASWARWRERGMRHP
jgi:hypothetical protein